MELPHAPGPMGHAIAKADSGPHLVQFQNDWCLTTTPETFAAF